MVLPVGRGTVRVGSAALLQTENVKMFSTVCECDCEPGDDFFEWNKSMPDGQCTVFNSTGWNYPADVLRRQKYDFVLNLQ